EVQAIPYELESLLAAFKSYQMNVAAGALPGDAPITLAPIFGPITSGGATLSTAILSTRARATSAIFAATNPEIPVAPSPAPGIDPGRFHRPPTIPVKPTDLETAIEIPWRLQISPNQYGRWEHETKANGRGGPKRTELWRPR